MSTVMIADKDGPYLVVNFRKQKPQILRKRFGAKEVEMSPQIENNWSRITIALFNLKVTSWLNTQCIGSWSYLAFYGDKESTIFFERSTDAILFKLSLD